MATEFSLAFGRISGRRHLAFVIAVIAVTLTMDFWLSSRTDGSILGRGLLVFGFSSLILIWYAWSRPVLAGPRGLMLGANYVAWNGVTGVTVIRGTGGARVIIELRKYHPVYRKTVVGATTDEQASLLLDWVPKHLG